MTGMLMISRRRSILDEEPTILSLTATPLIAMANVSSSLMCAMQRLFERFPLLSSLVDIPIKSNTSPS
jgi:hypothetical protein